MMVKIQIQQKHTNQNKSPSTEESSEDIHKELKNDIDISDESEAFFKMTCSPLARNWACYSTDNAVIDAISGMLQQEDTLLQNMEIQAPCARGQQHL